MRDGVLLGLLVTAQLFTGEELLLLTGIAGGADGGGARRWDGRGRCPAGAARPRHGLGVAAAVTLLLAGYALWVQFFGPLTQRGSSFTPDFFKNDLTGFVTPSRYLLFHTAASAASAASYQGGARRSTSAYLGWPLIAVLAVAAAGLLAAAGRPRHRGDPGRARAALARRSSAGRRHRAPGVTLPWHWLESVPVLGTALPGPAVDRRGRRRRGPAGVLRSTGPGRGRHGHAGPRSGGRAAVATAAAVAPACPLIPRPLPAATATPLPAGWSAAFAALRLPPHARVLVVPVPTATLTDALRWQADTGEPDSLIGGYFIGPAWNGQAYMEGNGVAADRPVPGLRSGPAARPCGPRRGRRCRRICAPGGRPRWWRSPALTPRSGLSGRIVRTAGHSVSGSVLAWRR